MAGEIPPLNIKVNIDTSTVTVGVAKATAGLEQISARAKTMTGSFGKFKEMALGVFGGNLLTSGVMGITHALEEMKAEAIATEVATGRLMSAMDNMNGVTEANKKAVEENTAAYSTLGFENSDALTGMGTLLTATNDITQANKLMAMSADYARYRHVSLTDAARVLARGTQGSAKAFKEMGITLDTTIPKNQAIAKAFDQLNAKIGGQAQAYTKTFAGRMDVLRERLQEVGDAIASKVLPVLSAFLGYIVNNGQALLIYGGIVLGVITTIKVYGATVAAIKSIQQAYAFWTYAQAASTNVFRFALSALWTTMKANPVGFIVAALMALGAAFVYAWNRFQGFREVVIKGLQIVVNGFGYLVGAVAKALELLGKIPMFGWAKEAAKGASNLAKSVRDYSDSLDKLANKKISTPKISGIVTPGGKTGITGNIVGGDTTGTGGGGSSTTVQYVTVYASNTNDIAKKLSKAAKNGTPIGGGK
jgi:hypothetical protein